MTIGFNNGTYFKLQKIPIERFSPKYFDIFSCDGAWAIELACIQKEMIHAIITLDASMFQKFSIVTLHGTVMEYSDSPETHNLLNLYEKAVQKLNIKNVVIHAEYAKDLDIFLKHPKLPVSIENMDHPKKFGHSVDQIESILEKYPFGLTLDVQHCYVNDSTLALAREFHKKFREKIVEYHVSGSDENAFHSPLFKTRQKQIISAIECKEIPIIIESVFEKMNEHKKELKYIISELNK